MKKIITVIIALTAIIWIIPAVAQAGPCDQKCLLTKISALEKKVAALEEGPELTSEEQGYVNEETEEKTTGVEGETSSWTFTCPPGFVALPTFPNYNVTPGAPIEQFGSELFDGGSSFQAFVAGGSLGHPIIMKARGVCLRGHYSDFGE